MTKNHGGNIKD